MPNFRLFVMRGKQIPLGLSDSVGYYYLKPITLLIDMAVILGPFVIRVRSEGVGIISFKPHIDVGLWEGHPWFWATFLVLKAKRMHFQRMARNTKKKKYIYVYIYKGTTQIL